MMRSYKLIEHPIELGIQDYTQLHHLIEYLLLNQNEILDQKLQKTIMKLKIDLS